MKRAVGFMIFFVFLLPKNHFPMMNDEHSNPPDVSEILRLAVEKAQRLEESHAESFYTFKMAVISQTLNKDDSIKDAETRLYENVPLPGGSYERLIEIDGRPLTEKERREEAKREEKFRQQWEKDERSDQGEEGQVSFDEELISRYDFELKGLENIGDRPAYVITFHPKHGKLPSRRRIDRALNKSRGTLWIDQASYAITKLEFELMEKVQIWWGIIGSISHMRGKLNFQPLDDETWFPSSFEFYINARIFFRAVHKNQTITWNDFRKEADMKAGQLSPSLH